MNVRDILVASAIMAGIAASAPAQVPPFGEAPYFHEGITTNLSFPAGPTAGPTDGPESILLIGDCGDSPNFSCSAGSTVTTTGNPSAFVVGSGHAEGLAALGGALQLNASAMIRYSYRAERVFPTPQFIPFVPMVFIGSVSAEASGRGSAGAEVALRVSDSSVRIVLAQASVAEGSLLPDYSPYVTYLGVRENAVVTIEMLASGTFRVSEGGASFKAFADPYIQIDPAFEFKDYYRIIFNTPDILNSPPVPEPGSLILLVLGALGVARFSLRRRHK